MHWDRARDNDQTEEEESEDESGSSATETVLYGPLLDIVRLLGMKEMWVRLYLGRFWICSGGAAI